MTETERNIVRGLRRRLRQRWRASGTRREESAAAALGNVHEALHRLPALLEATALPNGVVELVVEDAHIPGRCLLDIHDGRATHAEPGTIVPWASISGSHSAWALALGTGEAAGLRLTGDEHLARRVMAALPRSALGVRSLAQRATA